MGTAIVTGLFTLIAALSVQWLQSRRQRAKEHEARLWERQAKTYVTLIQYQGGGMADEANSATSQELAVRDEISAEAAAYASREVLDLWQKSARASWELSEYVMDNWPEFSDENSDEQAVRRAMEGDTRFSSLRSAREDARRRLSQRVREELGSMGS